MPSSARPILIARRPAPQEARTLTIADHQALQVTQQPVEWTNGKLDFPSVAYYVASGDNVLIVKEEYSTGGQPSPTLTHVVTSLKFTHRRRARQPGDRASSARDGEIWPLLAHPENAGERGEHDGCGA